VLGRYVNDISDSFTNDPNITKEQKTQARKAAGTLLMTQFALAGVLGLPGVAAVMALLQDKFGVQAETATRKGIAYLAGADQDNSGFRGLLAETAMNGAANQFLGVNIGPRLGMPDFLGFSSYEGFNLSDASASASLVSNWMNGLGYLAQGDVNRGVTRLAPNFLRRTVSMAANKMTYGDYQFRNPMGKPIYDPSVPELLAYNLGFDPSRLTEAKRKDKLISDSNRAFEHQRNKEVNDAAVQLLQGNRAPTVEWVKKELNLDPSLMLGDPMAPARTVADKASELRQVQDPLASTPLGNSNEAKAIAQTFPGGLTERRSEVEALRERIRQEAAAGAPRQDYAPAVEKAVLIDAMVKKGMTKAQAEQALKMMGY